MILTEVAGVYLDREAALALRVMCEAAAAEGVRLRPAEGYCKRGSHVNGRCVDFENVRPSLAWLAENAAKFGFVQTIPEREVWHYEYRPRRF